MVWSTEEVDTPLTNYQEVPTWDNTVGESVGSSRLGYISSDIFSAGTQNTVDTASYYKYTNFMAPSPYAADGSFNEDYIRKLDKYNNALSDFNGASNTKTLVGLGSAYVAANACNLYSSEGIGAGNWYLPAAGELGYIIPRLKVIQAALSACGGVALSTYTYYFCSTEYNEADAYRIGINDGSVSDVYKSYGGDGKYVRPFVSFS